MPIVFCLFRALVYIVTFLLAGIALDVTQVFGLVLILLCYLGCTDPSSWMASLTTTLVFLRDLVLRLISGSWSVGLSLVFVLEDLIAGLLIAVLLVFFSQ